MSTEVSVSPDHEHLLRKLDTIARITLEDRAAVARLPLRIKTVAENADLVQEGDEPVDCCLVLNGFVARYKLLGQGQRQIFSFHIPGDIPDVHSLHMNVMDHSLGALTPVRVAYIPHSAMHEMIFHHPNLGMAFWRDTLIDAAVFREWLANVGRRTAYQRIAHLFCEMYVRLQSVGLVEAWSFQLPITQAELADGLGLSPVHVNRVLQDLRREGLIVSRGRVTEIVDWKRLQAAGDFDARYLHLRPHTG